MKPILKDGKMRHLFHVCLVERKTDDRMLKLRRAIGSIVSVLNFRWNSSSQKTLQLLYLILNATLLLQLPHLVQLFTLFISAASNKSLAPRD